MIKEYINLLLQQLATVLFLHGGQTLQRRIVASVSQHLALFKQVIYVSDHKPAACAFDFCATHCSNMKHVLTKVEQVPCQ